MIFYKVEFEEVGTKHPLMVPGYSFGPLSVSALSGLG